jgi:hypothetical protein
MQYLSEQIIFIHFLFSSVEILLGKAWSFFPGAGGMGFFLLTQETVLGQREMESIDLAHLIRTGDTFWSFLFFISNRLSSSEL